MISLNSVTAAAILAATAVNAQAAYEVAGNWYTNQVDSIQFTNFGSSGSYNAVTNMDSSNGACSTTPVAYSGSTAPLNNDVSVHLRGPFALSQFAFYSPSSSSKVKRHEEHKKDEHKKHHHDHAHAHAHAHKDKHSEEKRQVGAWVTVTMDGQVVSWINEWSGEPTTTSAAPAATPTPANAVQNAASNVQAAAASVTAAPSSSDDNSSGPYSRAAYYNAQSQTAQGLTFLNHNGGQGSGVFDYTFGSSLSYAASDAASGAASSEILADMTLPSDNEIVIMSDTACTEATCGYSRPGSVAYEGFGGSDKIFVFEFTMPSDGSTGFNANMPALWLLNAQIPRTQQYGSCSCWASGCGELDLMEVLDSGDYRCKATLHGNVAGGDSAWIMRPQTSTMQLAVVMSDNLATIKVLDGSFDFGSGLSQSQIDDFSSANSLISGLVGSLFPLTK